MVTANTIISFSDTTTAGLVTQVNTWLATVTDIIIRSTCLTIQDRSRRLGTECNMLIEYEEPSAVPIAEPFEIAIEDAGTLGDLTSAVAAFMLANSTAFINVPALFSVDNDNNNKLIRYYALLIINANHDAYQNFGATAQMTPLPH